MRTIFGICFAALLLGPGLAACGDSSGRYLATATVRTALQEAGFSNLRVHSQRNAADQLARRQADYGPGALKEVRDEDVIYGPPTREGWPTLLAVRMQSHGMTKETFERVYNSKAISEDLAHARKEGVLPNGFARDKLRTARVCNVILWSYNADRDPRITESFDRAVRLLRAGC